MPDIPETPQPLVRALSVPSLEEVQSLLVHLERNASAWKAHRLYALVSLLVWAGLTREEAIKLGIADIDVSAGTIRYRRREGWKKSPRRPLVSLDSNLTHVLGEWLPRVGSGCEWAFPGDQKIGPWHEGQSLRALKEAARGAGVEAIVNFESLHRFSERFGARTIPGLTLGALRKLPEGIPLPDMPAKPRNAPAAPVHDLTDDEVDRLMAMLRGQSATWKGNRLYCLVSLALMTGLARDELLDLGGENIRLDLTSPCLSIPGRTATTTLTADAAAILGRWVKRPDYTGKPVVFPNASLTGPWISDDDKNRTGFRSQLHDAAREAGIQGRVTYLALTRYWQRSGRNVVFGEAWRSVPDPDPIPDGPQQVWARGPKPKTPWRSRRRENLARGKILPPGNHPSRKSGSKGRTGRS